MDSFTDRHTHDAELVAVLQRNSAEVDFTDLHPHRPGANGPLHIAVIRRNRTDVKFLLDRGARVNEPGDMRFTPLHNAAWKADVLLVELLLKRGADRPAVNEFGKTPWQMVEARHEELPRRTFTALKQLLR